MSETTPSQAEGERDTDIDDAGGTAPDERTDPPRTTPSQAEGEDDQDAGDTDG
ncbi:hypothetical protein [Streptomyces alfalfae]|uniref:Uncharacterized protein n=1 Tax=Streptomyces alfalfae TaxID=1642299 RepID=A0A7T4U0R6_9ACTN|nr:hypothetical protein [Streptomyces alfalfae]QQC92073.1 hypothetical protein I8755_29505 [Streptomyces alfalfae]QUI34594.1 hypothetical protein H9W91_29875 [Streptomyces alfalfae]